MAHHNIAGGVELPSRFETYSCHRHDIHDRFHCSHLRGPGIELRRAHRHNNTLVGLSAYYDCLPHFATPCDH